MLVGAAVLALEPVLFMLMTALKTQDQYLDDTLGPPWPLSFSNFREALHGGDFFIWLKNSAIMTLGAVIVSTLSAALCAFAIARMRFRGQNLLLSLNIALMIVPPVVLLHPALRAYSDLGADQHLPRRDHHLRRAHGAVLGLPADELLPHDPARVARVGAWRTARRTSACSGRSCCRSRRRRS